MAHVRYNIPKGIPRDERRKLRDDIVSLLGKEIDWHSELCVYEFNETTVTVHYEHTIGRFAGGYIIGEKKQIADTANKLGLEKYMGDKE